MFSELALEFNGHFRPLSIYPAACDRKIWDTLDKDMIREILKDADDHLHFKYPYISATDFLEYSRTGDRSKYETKLFSKRLALSSLVLGECITHDGHYLDDIINGIYSICDESAWQLPAHNTYVRDTPALPLPDTTHPIIELFSCETAAILSTVQYLLRDELDKVSPFIAVRIWDEIRRRVLTPYMTEHFWWMGQGDEQMCNWTVWCTQNILICAFSLDLTKEEGKKILVKACQSIDCFLKDYGDDGCCDEGAQYYRHAGLCLFQSLEILDHVTDGHFSSLWKNEKIRNIALYILNVHVDDKYYINFADCSPIAGRAGAREFLFGKRTNQPELCAFAALDHRHQGTVIDPLEHNLFYRLQEIFTENEMLSYPIPEHIPHHNVYYKSVGLMVLRNNVWTMGIKAGCNGDNHNHNDTGSVTIYKSGKPFLIDIGVESYTAKTFSKQRYEIWTMQSDYHNLPTLNGYMQADGHEYQAEVQDLFLSEKSGNIAMELSKAYPKEAGVISYVRHVSFIGNDPNAFSENPNTPGTPAPVIEDNWNLKDLKNPGPVILNLITYEKPVLSDDSHIMLGGLGKIRITTPDKNLPDDHNINDHNSQVSDIRIEELPVTDERLRTCWKHSLYRIRIRLNALSGNIQLQLF